MSANTNNVNKTRVLLQTTGGKGEPDIVFMICDVKINYCFCNISL